MRTFLSSGSQLLQAAEQMLVVVRQPNDVDADAAGQASAASFPALATARIEDEQAGSRHECRSDERLGTRVGVVAVDEHRARPHAPQCVARGFVRLGKARLVSHELHRGAEERGGKRIGGQNEYVGTAHVVVPARGSKGEVPGSRRVERQEGDHAASATRSAGPLTRAWRR